jgi:conjugal transfer/entry exclusion protein
MPVFNSSKSSAADNRQVATDLGKNVRGKKNVTADAVGLIVTGAKKGTTQVTLNSGVSNSDLSSLLGTVTSATGGQINAVTSLAQQQAKQFADLAKAQQETLSKLTDAQQKDVADLADNKQSNGDSSRNRIVLIVVLTVLGLVGLFIWKRH